MLRVDVDMPLIMSSHATIRPSCRLCDDRLDPCAVGTFGTRDTSIALYAYMVKHLPNMAFPHTRFHARTHTHILYIRPVTLPLLLEAFHRLPDRFGAQTNMFITTLLSYTAANPNLQHALWEILHCLSYTQIAQNLLGTPKDSIELVGAVELFNDSTHSTLGDSATSEDVDGFICNLVCRTSSIRLE